MTSRARTRQLSEPTISRLPIYQRIVEGWAARGQRRIDSRQIAEMAGVTATTVRRDLAALGSLGTRGAGYEPAVLAERIGEALGHDLHYDVIVVGLGNLGRALVNSSNFLIRGAHLAGLYDVDPHVLGTEVAGLVVADARGELMSATLGVICVPGPAAQEVADRLVAAGVRGILNFAPQVLSVPLGTAVHYVDFSIELQILAFHLTNGTGPLGGVLHSVGLATTGPGPGA